MPASITESSIPMTGAGLIGKSASGVGDSTLMDAAAVRSLCSVYSTTQVDSSLALKATITGSTGSLVMPSGTTAQRDGSPSVGYERWNTTTSRRETWTGATWENNVRLSGDTMTGTLATPSVIGLGGTSSLTLDNAGTGGTFLCFNAANRGWVGNGGVGFYLSAYPMNDNLYDLGITGGSPRYWRTLYVNSITCVGAVTSGAITASDTICNKNGATAQKLLVYNIDTSATSYERAVIDWVTVTNTCCIGTEKGSAGGTARDLALVTDATVRLTINGTTGLTTISDGVSISGGVLITLGSDATGDMLYRNSGGAIARLPIGSTNQVLTVAGGLPSWAAASGGTTWSYATGTDAATAMSVNTWYNVDMSGWATADRIYSLPSTAAVGDRVAVYITAGNATTFEMDLQTASGSSDTIRGVDRSSSSWSRLFITGELVIFECTVANTNWAVVHDGRIPCEVIMARTTAKTGNTNAIDIEIDGYGTPSVNVGNLANATNGRITARRACRGMLSGKTRFTYTSGASIQDGSITILLARVNGANDSQRQDQYSIIGGAAVPIVMLTGEVDLVVGDYCSLFGFVNDSRAGTFEMGSASWNYPRFVFRELLAP